jgi:hypothetical protein
MMFHTAEAMLKRGKEIRTRHFEKHGDNAWNLSFELRGPTHRTRLYCIPYLSCPLSALIS